MCKPLQKSNMLNEFLHKYRAKHTHTTAAAQSFIFWFWMQVDWAPTPVAYYFLLALTRRPTSTKWSVMNRSTPKVSKEITAPSLENTWVTFFSSEFVHLCLLFSLLLSAACLPVKHFLHAALTATGNQSKEWGNERMIFWGPVYCIWGLIPCPSCEADKFPYCLSLAKFSVVVIHVELMLIKETCPCCLSFAKYWQCMTSTQLYLGWKVPGV